MEMDLLKMLGTMMMPASGMTSGVGIMIHAVMSIVFASAHAAFYLWLDIEASYATGLLFGLVQFIGTGIFFGMLASSIHRGIRDGAVAAPGFFALKLGEWLGWVLFWFTYCSAWWSADSKSLSRKSFAAC